MLPAVRQVLEPRLMMTAAMAFFSIALTLNLTGIKITQLRAADLQPSRLRANLTRQFYSTNEQVTKYYENLRLVYEMESRVRELRRTTEAEPAPSPRETPKPPARDGSGSPSSTVPRGQQVPPVPGGSADPFQKGMPVQPAEMVPAGFDPGGRRGKFTERGFQSLCRHPLKTRAPKELGMNCLNHPDVAAAAYCQNCGKPLCTACMRSVGGVVYCEPCLAARLSAAPGAAEAGLTGMHAHPVLAGLLGFIPGVGAMYNGQFVKALAHVLIFAVFVSLSDKSVVLRLAGGRMGLLPGL